MLPLQEYPGNLRATDCKHQEVVSPGKVALLRPPALPWLEKHPKRALAYE